MAKRKYFNSVLKEGSSNGFTLIEILIVVAIISITTAAVVTNFSSVRPSLDQATSVLLSDVRVAQTKTTGSNKYDDEFACGYGIKHQNTTSYSLYVNLSPCAPKQYSAGSGDIVIASNSLDTGLEFKTSNWDIFFEPPDPATYFSGVLGAGSNATALTIGKTGTACTSANCRTVCVYPNGRVEPTLGNTCP